MIRIKSWASRYFDKSVGYLEKFRRFLPEAFFIYVVLLLNILKKIYNINCLKVFVALWHVICVN